MANSKASSVAPLPTVSGAAECGPDAATESTIAQPRDFHFAVTWVTLFAHLDPVLSNGPRPRSSIPAPTLALVPVVAPMPLIEQRPMPTAVQDESEASWEMVVPKMIRTGRTFVPAEGGSRGGKKPELL